MNETLGGKERNKIRFVVLKEVNGRREKEKIN